MLPCRHHGSCHRCRGGSGQKTLTNCLFVFLFVCLCQEHPHRWLQLEVHALWQGSHFLIHCKCLMLSFSEAWPFFCLKQTFLTRSGEKKKPTLSFPTTPLLISASSLLSGKLFYHGKTLTTVVAHKGEMKSPGCAALLYPRPGGGHRGSGFCRRNRMKASKFPVSYL